MATACRSSRKTARCSFTARAVIGRFPSLTEALAGIPCRSAVIDGELCFRTGIGAPDFAGLQLALSSRQHHKLTVFAFDLLHRDGADLRQLPLTERRRRLERLLARSDVPCLRLVATFDDGGQPFAEAERRQLEGIVSKRKASPYRSGPSRDWRKVKTAAWRVANRERWRLFEKGVSLRTAGQYIEQSNHLSRPQ
jgi:bifunctional non-homologous end joining protein LigD